VTDLTLRLQEDHQEHLNIIDINQILSFFAFVEK